MVTSLATRFAFHGGSGINGHQSCTRLFVISTVVSLCFWMFLFYQTVNIAPLLTNSFPILCMEKTQNSTNRSVVNFGKQRAVILAGPHKAASSSIQSNLYSWSKIGSLGQDWSWVTPNMTCVHEHSAACQNPVWLLLPQQIHKVWNCAGICLHNETLNKISNLCSGLLSCYSDALRETVLAKKNTVFGYEGFVHDVAQIKETGKAHEKLHYIQKIVDTLPSTFLTKDDITVVITYRVPRIDQVTSSWKHQRDIEKAYHGTPLSFRSFLSSKLFETYKFDSLGVAKVIAEEFGLNVVVLDTSGVQLMGYDISYVVACKVLGSPCHPNNMTLEIGGNASAAFKANVREDDKILNDLTSEEKLTIESILQKLDCNSAHLIFQHPKIQVIYPYLLNQTHHSCSMNHTYYSHEQALQDIQSAISPEAQMPR
jgi:hypothetical protein